MLEDVYSQNQGAMLFARRLAAARLLSQPEVMVTMLAELATSMS